MTDVDCVCVIAGCCDISVPDGNVGRVGRNFCESGDEVDELESVKLVLNCRLTLFVVTRDDGGVIVGVSDFIVAFFSSASL